MKDWRQASYVLLPKSYWENDAWIVLWFELELLMQKKDSGTGEGGPCETLFLNETSMQRPCSATLAVTLYTM